MRPKRIARLFLCFTTVVFVGLVAAAPTGANEEAFSYNLAGNENICGVNSKSGHPLSNIELMGGETAGEKEMVSCTEPRPQVCAQNYLPVCAQLEDGSHKTYSNGCTACADASVIGYRKGACN